MHTTDARLPLGANVRDGQTHFRIYTTRAKDCAVRLLDPDGQWEDLLPLTAEGDGHFSLRTRRASHGTLYTFRLDGKDVPDPYARFAPRGVHGPPMVVEPRHAWRFPAAPQRPLSQQVIYELHIGTFTREGTYDSARQRLGHLAALGVTTIELMPLSSFPGKRGWGYDGVLHFAPFAPYGTPDDLRRFIDEAHGHGMCVLLDVVYNHLGPDGNYLRVYSEEYFTAEVQTPWGDALDFGHDVTRRFVLDNALYWLTEFRFDGLRLDATQEIVDRSSLHILRELSDAVLALRPKKLLVAEDAQNDPTLVTEHGMDAVWADDFHHQLHATLTREQDGYYAGFTPGAEGLATAVTRGWIYEGQIFPPWGTSRGKPAVGLDRHRLVYGLQNHDQVGNRAFGDRLSDQISERAYLTASMLLLFMPATPLLFMGQEWAATSPFRYFTDHEPGLGKLVTEGRRREFASFGAFGPDTIVPDPQAEQTFVESKLHWSEIEGKHARVLAFYRDMLAFRREDPVMRATVGAQIAAVANGDVLIVRRESPEGIRVLIANLGIAAVELKTLVDPAHHDLLLASDDGAMGALLPGETCAIYRAGGGREIEGESGGV
jgi:maltooligosyltrehalose trehalohydrolase